MSNIKVGQCKYKKKKKEKTLFWFHTVEQIYLFALLTEMNKVGSAVCRKTKI